MNEAMRQIEEKAVDNPQPWARKTIEEYLRSDGADVDHPLADDIVLLYVKGRKTGTVRRVPLARYRDGDDHIVIGSKGGAPRHPAWFLNLRDDPQVWVRDKSEIFEGRAEVLDGAEHKRMWDRVTRWAPGFQKYQDRTERRIPLIRISRI
jgi:deazaflavin-dependent oxidoreductase (nitroreductase family)